MDEPTQNLEREVSELKQQKHDLEQRIQRDDVLAEKCLRATKRAVWYVAGFCVLFFGVGLGIGSKYARNGHEYLNAPRGPRDIELTINEQPYVTSYDSKNNLRTLRGRCLSVGKEMKCNYDCFYTLDNDVYCEHADKENRRLIGEEKVKYIDNLVDQQIRVEEESKKVYEELGKGTK